MDLRSKDGYLRFLDPLSYRWSIWPYISLSELIK